MVWKSLQGAIKESHTRHIVSADIFYFVYASLKVTIFIANNALIYKLYTCTIVYENEIYQNHVNHEDLHSQAHRS